MLFIPFVFLGIMGMDDSSHPILRMLGMMLIFYGYYYLRAGLSKRDNKEFFKWTLHTRSVAILFLTAFALLGYLPWLVLVFGLLDLTGAAVTYYFIRTEKRLQS